MNNNLCLKEKGRKELNRLITKIGVPLNEAQQQYRYMNVIWIFFGEYFTN